MGSRREEERNEKIIRGLMKLPPNRRCINCNSVNPQYVCTNFWTFVCMTCSGIHREFTHRVKSVSMSKFISEEVEALQNGGNQRARDIYLKDWDLQRQRLPSSSNANKIREFIKNVYVDRKYVGRETSDKLSIGMQSPSNRGDTIRRPSSYHSYSESPPYDYQYENRRYGKQVAATLARNTGSDRGIFVRKTSSFIFSPGRLCDQMFEDRFANEGSAPRLSDYSASSGGDTFKSGTGSPNFQKEIVFGSPNSQPRTDVFSEDAQRRRSNLFVNPNSKKDAARIPQPHRTKSTGSFGSIDDNSMSVKSYNSGIGLDVVSEPEQTAGSRHDKASSVSQSSVPVNYGGLDHFNVPETSASPLIDLFQLPATLLVSSESVFQPAASLMPHGSLYQPSPSIPSIDLLSGISEQTPAASFGGKLPELSVPKNEGWAMFDTPQPATSGPVTENFSPAVMPGDGDLSVKFDQLQSPNTTMQWPLFENSSALSSSVISSQWREGLHVGQSSAAADSTQSWNAFIDSAESLSTEPQVVAYNHSATTNLHFSLGVSESLDNDDFQAAALQAGFPAANITNRDGIAPPYAPMGEKQLHAAGHKSTNPFDLPYDYEPEQNDKFLDTRSLQTALPNAQLPSTFLGGVSQPWFPQNPVTPYIPGTPQGGLASMSSQAPSSQLSNVPVQGPFASTGGNPFA
ncbi:probable ADP-ribosylation factor GTPase-activating protein AGD14 isoform X2 [Hibiscus syriacus]|uniref:probable ADP-ribosylation factor GTPase-activating protein AGD14 isoform X2 n=1 Tax=Hibiscus syriacus TaxID=106335 RepID=UPI001923BBED|nr:probable ADP-ribosylation factor GTPase-activating protein AGD14 isoform X2 [Hibiscus syriacus]